MNDAQNKGVRDGSRVDRSGGKARPPLEDYSEHWLEHRVRKAYQ